MVVPNYLIVAGDEVKLGECPYNLDLSERTSSMRLRESEKWSSNPFLSGVQGSHEFDVGVYQISAECWGTEY